MLRYFTILFVFFLSLMVANAQPVLLLDSEEESAFGKYMSVFKDSTNRLKLIDIVRLNRLFHPVETNYFSHPLSNNAYWVKFEIKNVSGLKYYLLVDNPNIRELEVYTIQNKKVVRIAHTGINHAFASRGVRKNNFVFHIPVSKNEGTTIYLKYISIRGELPLLIANAKALAEIFQLKDLSWGIFFGSMLAIIIYNLLVFIVLKDKGYFLQALFYLFLIISISILFGYSFQYFFPNHAWINKLLYPISAIGTVFGVLFSFEFLNLENISPGVYKGGLFFILILLSEVLISPFNELLAAQIDGIMKLLLAPYFIIAGIVAYNEGYKPSRFYLIATTLLFISAILNNFRILGIIPSNYLTINIVYFNIIATVILFSLALGDRYNLFKKEKDQVQKELNKELELKVIERTNNQKELESLNKNLIQTNTDLDNFIYTASHELKGPIVNIEGIMNILNSKKATDEDKELFKLILDSVSKFKVTVSDLTEVSKVQQLRDQKEESLDIKQVLNEIISDYKNELEHVEATINIDIAKDPHLTFSKINFIRIIKNILGNAIKFRSPERKPEVTITCDQTSGYFILHIKDNGIGIRKEYHDKIFSMFKKAHDIAKGRGVGLYMSKRLMENKGGKIELESEVDIGSTFSLFFKQ